MREFAKISCSIWSSEKFRALSSDDARYLYFYLHTCPHVNSLGCFVLRPGYALSDLGWDDNIETGAIRYRNSIEALSKANLIEFDNATAVVKIVDFLRHTPFANPKHAKGALRSLDAIPDCRIKMELISEINDMRHVEGDFLDTVSDTVSKRSRYTETKTKTETETETIGAGVGARAREADQTTDLTFRERLLHAAGIDPQSIISPGESAPGGRKDMVEAQKWITDLRFSEDEAVELVAAITAGMQERPHVLRYFSKAMSRAAGERDAKLTPTPIEGGTDNARRQAPYVDRRQKAANDAFAKRIATVARARPIQGGDWFDG